MDSGALSHKGGIYITLCHVTGSRLSGRGCRGLLWKCPLDMTRPLHCELTEAVAACTKSNHSNFQRGCGHTQDVPLLQRGCLRLMAARRGKGLVFFRDRRLDASVDGPALMHICVASIGLEWG